MKDGCFTTAVILAAGLGTRMKSETTKQQMKICGESVLFRAARAFEEAEKINAIVAVCREDELDFAKEELKTFKKLAGVVVGGQDRRQSAKRGFDACSGTDFVAIHDAARCMITSVAVDAVVSAAHKHGAASAVGGVVDTVKLLNPDGTIDGTVPRDGLCLAQTPQVFSSEIYKRALDASEGVAITDDNMMAELIKTRIKAVEVGGYNFKITTRKDIEYAEFLIEKGYAK